MKRVPQRRVAEQAAGDHVVLSAEAEHDAARDSGVLRPRDDDRRDHRVEQRRAERCRHDHREDDRRERHEEVGDAHQGLVDPSAEVAGDGPDHGADDHRGDHEHEREREAHGRTRHQAREDVAAVAVGAEQGVDAQRLQTREHLRVGAVGHPPLCGEGDDDPCSGDHGADHAEGRSPGSGPAESEPPGAGCRVDAAHAILTLGSRTP